MFFFFHNVIYFVVRDMMTYVIRYFEGGRHQSIVSVDVICLRVYDLGTRSVYTDFSGVFDPVVA